MQTVREQQRHNIEQIKAAMREYETSQPQPQPQPRPQPSLNNYVSSDDSDNSITNVDDDALDDPLGLLNEPNAQPTAPSVVVAAPTADHAVHTEVVIADTSQESTEPGLSVMSPATRALAELHMPTVTEAIEKAQRRSIRYFREADAMTELMASADSRRRAIAAEMGKERSTTKSTEEIRTLYKGRHTESAPVVSSGRPRSAITVRQTQALKQGKNHTKSNEITKEEEINSTLRRTSIKPHPTRRRPASAVPGGLKHMKHGLRF